MRIIAAIIKREYNARVRKRGFLFGTLVTPVIWLAAILLPILFVTLGGGERQVTILDQSGDPGLFEAIEKTVNDSLKNDPGTKFKLIHSPVPREKIIDEFRKEWNLEIENDSNRAYIVLRDGVLDGVPPEYYARNVTDTSIVGLGRAVATAVTQRRLVLAGFDPDRVSQFTKIAGMKTIKVTAQGESQDIGEALITSLLILFTIFSTVFGHSASVMGGVIEEKQSRIIEVLITSVEPYQIMTGKLIGIGLVGLTQYAIWGTCGLIIKLAAMLLSNVVGFNLPKVPVSLLLFCLIFFILGYFFTGTLYLIVGAISSKNEDAVQFATPLAILNFLPLLIFWLVLKDPNSTVSVTVSLIPFLAPSMMLVRIVAGTPPLWQIVLSILIMLLSIILALWIAAKVYRAGILIYGKRVTLSEIGRWLRY